MNIRKKKEKPMDLHIRTRTKMHRKTPLSKLIRRNKESTASIKMRKAALYSLGTLSDRLSEELEGGEELREAAMLAMTVASPAKNATEKVVKTGAELTSEAVKQSVEKTVDKAELVFQKYKIKKTAKDTSKHMARKTADEISKQMAKEAAKRAAKNAAKEAAKDVTKEVTIGAAEVTAEFGVEAGAATAGAAAGPEGILIGWAAGKKIGEEVGKKIEMEDARLYKRFRKIRWFIDKTRSEEEQKDSLIKVVRDHILRDLLTQLRVNKSLLAIWAGIIIMLIFTISVPAVTVFGVIYNSPLAIFFPMPDTGYDNPRTVLASYYMEFNQKVLTLEESGNSISYKNTDNGVPINNFNDTLLVYMVLYGDGQAGYVMDDKGKKNLKKVFDEMNYIDDSSTTKEVKAGDSLGKVWATAYCPCAICCGPYANGITASGKKATAKHTIAVDAYNPIVPMGTKVIIEGVEYTVEDTGDLNHYGNDFDIFYAHHEDCLQWGRKNVEAFLAEGDSNTVTVTTSGTTVHNLTYKDYMEEKKLNDDQKKMLADLMDSDLWDVYYSGAAGQTVAELAYTKLGCKYDQSRRMEEGYYDCSSLVYRLYKEVGIELPYVADTQGYYCYQNAMLVNKKDLKPGDLIFYSYEENGCFRNISHVAIYVGDGMMIHAAGKARGVVLDPLRESNVVFYARPYK
ncbi:NlpC/P60 family protein [Lachnospiraceae bacterium]|nr:NlpC/P60 family protein [Lachnospiraceae bacterium]